MLLPIFCFCLLTVLSQYAHAESTEQMLSYCRAIANAQLVEGKINFPTDFPSGMCWGAFAAFQEAIGASHNNVRLLGVCSPSRKHTVTADTDFCLVARRIVI
jgi:hypothetical protein